MADEPPAEHVVDIGRHGGTETQSEPVPPPQAGGNFALDESVINGKDDPALMPYTRQVSSMLVSEIL